MRKNVFLVALGLLLSVVVTSCAEKSPFPGYTPTGTGLYYKQITQGAGEQVKLGDVVQLDLAYYVNDSLLYSTDAMPEPIYDKVNNSSFPGDLYEGLQLMHVGDSMSFMINADSVFRKMFRAPVIPDYVKPGTFLRWEVKVNEALAEADFIARKEAEMAAKQQKAAEELTAYLAENNITTPATESGLVYVRTKPGKGKNPSANNFVKVHYTGKLLDGTVFDSSVERGEPFEFQLGMHQVIPGCNEGIALMKKGEKGILYIPAELAYGPRQAGIIPPFSNLIFEVELVDFK